MREIKFRAWDGEKMHKAFDLSQNPLYWWKDNYDYPLMQYTGLKDKNGVEIYEGDILEVEEIDGDFNITGTHKTAVEYRTGQWNGSPFTIFAGSFSITKVIGNIYENPELLKETN